MKPYIITHMAISVDGRIDADHWETTSMLQYPLVDGRMNTPALFDIKNEPTLSRTTLQLASVERLPHDILWLRYKVRT